jgi:hypothetical protein
MAGAHAMRAPRRQQHRDEHNAGSPIGPTLALRPAQWLIASNCSSKGSNLNLNPPAGQAFFTYALHHPLALTCFPPKIGHGPAASPGLP